MIKLDLGGTCWGSGLRFRFQNIARKLGVPTVADRVARTVVKLVIEPGLDAIFHLDSYGYRPGRSAKQAVAITRECCWRYDWVVEFDIKAAFDQIDHGLLMKVVRTHIREDWILLYIERWLGCTVRVMTNLPHSAVHYTPTGGLGSGALFSQLSIAAPVSPESGLDMRRRDIQTSDSFD